MTFTQAKSYLDSFINYEFHLNAVPIASFKLQRVAYLLELLGRPQEKIRVIHVAGTKGKGSTCAFAAHILKAAGYRVGLYTSPHLENFKERIRVLEKDVSYPQENNAVFPDCIDDEELCSVLEEMKPSLEKMKAVTEYGPLSYFEVVTVLALCYFRKREVDFVVLETGLGGRLDATNAVDAAVYGITPISLEHTQQLGETLSAIAAEKAAIIKGKSVAVIAPQLPKAFEVIEKRCQEQGVAVCVIGRDITFELIHQDTGEQSFCVQGIRGKYELKTRLLGAHQVMNAAVAVGLVESLGVPILPDAMEKGIFETVWPGRFEIVRQKPVVVLDAAHNPDSSRKLAETVKEIFPGRNTTLILGLCEDKDQYGICRHLNGISQKIILTQARHPRACCFTDGEVEKIFKTKECLRTQNVQEAVDEALAKTDEGDIILVTGSIFVVAEARTLFRQHSTREACINSKV